MTTQTKKYSFWWEHTAPDFVLQPQLPLHADLVIIGAGFAGISTAYWALRRTKNRKTPYKILVLEEGPHAAFKSSGRMNGCFYLGSNEPVTSVVDNLGKKVARKLYDYSNKNNNLLQSIIDRGVDCDLERNGGFRMATTNNQVNDLDSSADILEDWGYYPARFNSTNSQHIAIAPLVKSSLFIPGEGMFDPFAFCNKVARILRHNRVNIVYGTQVERAINTNEHGPRVILTNGHVITAGKIVHTTPVTVPCNRVDENILYRREQAVRTERMSSDLDDMPLPIMPVELANGKDSLRVHNGAILMTGGKAGLRNDPEEGIINDNGCNPRVLQHLDKSMMEYFPLTNHMEISHTWTYIETLTSDGLPLMGEIPNYPGHYVNIGHGRNKFGLAFLGAKNIVERIVRTKVNDPEFNIFNVKRLTRGE